MTTQEVTNKDFEVKVLMNTRGDKDHKDVTVPQVAKKPGANGKTGKFFQVSLKVKDEGAIVEQGRKYIFSIWDSGQRALIFEKIARLLLDKNNFDIDDLDKGAIIKNNKLIFRGDLCTEFAIDTYGKRFSYHRTGTDGKPLINPRTKMPTPTNTVSMFIFDFERNNGTKEVLFAAECNRAFEHRVEKTEPDEDTGGKVTLEEEQQ